MTKKEQNCGTGRTGHCCFLVQPPKIKQEPEPAKSNTPEELYVWASDASNKHNLDATRRDAPDFLPRHRRASMGLPCCTAFQAKNTQTNRPSFHRAAAATAATAATVTKSEQQAILTSRLFRLLPHALSHYHDPPQTKH